MLLTVVIFLVLCASCESPGGTVSGERREMVAAQNGSREGGQAGGPTFGTLNTIQAMRMQSLSPQEDRPFFMLNLVKYREQAVYPDGRETNLTGREADQQYSPMEFLAAVGAEIAYAGAVEAQLAGSEPTWETVAIVRYPSRAKFFQMTTNRQYQAREQHKEAGLEISQVMVTVPVPWVISAEQTAAVNDIPFPATDQDKAFTLLDLAKYKDVAQYPAGNVEPERSGREAMDLFEQALLAILGDVGARPIMKARVEGVLIGDGREWSELRMIHFPSHSAYRELRNKLRSGNARYHRTAAIEDIYTLQLKPMIDRTEESVARRDENGAVSLGSTSPDPSRAPMILGSLDKDNDSKISESEAPADMKQNFAFIDTNGDGGIDLAELRKVLTMMRNR